MFLSELIDLRTRESPTDAPHFSFRLDLPYSDPPFEANLDGRRHSVTTLLQKPLAGPASIVQNAPARSQITIRDAEVKRAEIGHIRRQTFNLDAVSGVYQDQSPSFASACTPQPSFPSSA